MRMTKFFLFASLAASAIAPPAFGKDVKVGIVQATSGGSAALYGIMQKNAAELAISEINAAGGEYKLVPIYQDDAGDRGQTVNIFQRLIFQDRVAAIFGPTLTNSAYAADPLAQKAKVLVIASSNTAPGVTSMGDYVFRTCATEPTLFPNVLDYVIKRSSPKTAAQIYGIDDMLMKTAYGVHKSALEKAGIKIVDTETFQKGDVDYSAQLTKIKAAQPDMIVIGGLAEETANIVRQARQLGIPKSTIIIGANAAISKKLRELAGDAAEGFLVGSGWFIDSDVPLNRSFVAAYRAKYKSDPDTFAAQAYAAVYIFADALKRAGGADDPAKLRDALAVTKDMPTSLGNFSFDANREPVLKAKVLELTDGKFALATGQ